MSSAYFWDIGSHFNLWARKLNFEIQQQCFSIFLLVFNSGHVFWKKMTEGTTYENFISIVEVIILFDVNVIYFI